MSEEGRTGLSSSALAWIVLHSDTEVSQLIGINQYVLYSIICPQSLMKDYDESFC